VNSQTPGEIMLDDSTKQAEISMVVVVLAYGDGGQCQALLTELSTHPDLDASRVIVVHNPSLPGEVLRLVDGTRATVIENSSNLGYAAGMNVGMTRALDLQAEFVLFLTHDVRIGASDIDALCNALMSDERFAAVGPALSLPDGSLYSTGMTRIGPRRSTHRSVRRPENSFQPWECDSLDGSAMLWRASVLRELGGFDSRFFMYMEDVELCARAVRAGWKIGSVDKASAVSMPGGKQRLAAHAYLRTRNGLEYARSQGAQYVAFEVWALLLDYWRHAPKPGGTRFGQAEYHAAARRFRQGATLGVLDFLRRRWGPPPAKLLSESDIGSIATRKI
jgi:N-acetylglucosaminyl-diphospho-decaprenol L-rhamnosyltransferase